MCRFTRMILGVLLGSILCGVSPCGEKSSYVELKQDSVSSQKIYPVLTEKASVEAIKNQNELLFSCIVEKFIYTGADGDRSVGYRFLIPDMPKYGGLLWKNCDLKKLEAVFKKHQQNSIWFAVKAKLNPFSVKHQTNPAVDPWGVVQSLEVYGFYVTPKHQFPVGKALQEK